MSSGCSVPVGAVSCMSVILYDFSCHLLTSVSNYLLMPVGKTQQGQLSLSSLMYSKFCEERTTASLSHVPPQTHGHGHSLEQPTSSPPSKKNNSLFPSNHQLPNQELGLGSSSLSMLEFGVGWSCLDIVQLTSLAVSSRLSCPKVSMSQYSLSPSSDIVFVPSSGVFPECWSGRGLIYHLGLSAHSNLFSTLPLVMNLCAN